MFEIKYEFIINFYIYKILTYKINFIYIMDFYSLINAY